MDLQYWVEGIKVFLEKLGTLLIDRRVFYFALTLLISLGVLPITFEEADALDQQLVDGILLFIQGAVMVFGVLGGLVSFGIRPPSGRSFKQDEVVARYLNERFK